MVTTINLVTNVTTGMGQASVEQPSKRWWSVTGKSAGNQWARSPFLVAHHHSDTVAPPRSSHLRRNAVGCPPVHVVRTVCCSVMPPKPSQVVGVAVIMQGGDRWVNNASVLGGWGQPVGSCRREDAGAVGWCSRSQAGKGKTVWRGVTCGAVNNGAVCMCGNSVTRRRGR